MNAATFGAHVGSTFVAMGDDGEVDLALESVEDLPRQRGAPRPDPFRMVFVGPATPVLPQRMRRLDHGVLGGADVFLVPLGPGPGGGVVYEAIFN